MYQALGTFVALMRCASKIGFAIIAPLSGSGLTFLLLDEEGVVHQVNGSRYLTRLQLRTALMWSYEDWCDRRCEEVRYEQFD